MNVYVVDKYMYKIIFLCIFINIDAVKDFIFIFVYEFICVLFLQQYSKP